MGNMRFKVGDRVRIKSIDWYNENKDADGIIDCGVLEFDEELLAFCGKIVTINSLASTNAYDRDCYTIIEDNRRYNWTDEMIEGLAEEETLIERVDDNGLPFNEWLSHKGAFHIPDGYELKDENGNVINATKIVLEKKQKEYPKTYEECAKILRLGVLNELKHYSHNIIYRIDLIVSLHKLLICRDAYWKIAGEEMGLGKPWEPDWTIESSKYIILFKETKIEKHVTCKYSRILAFPTAEMRDAFYENFKELIESVKELL